MHCNAVPSQSPLASIPDLKRHTLVIQFVVMCKHTEFGLESNYLLESVIAWNACRYYVNDCVVTQVVHGLECQLAVTYA